MRIPYAPHTSYLRETLRFLSRRGMGREGTRGWAGNSRPAPTAPPLPRAQWQILKIDRNVIFFCKPHINDAARHVATNALPPYAHARPTATVCAYHANRPSMSDPTVFVAPRRAASLSSHSPFPLMPMWSQMVVGGDASQRNPRKRPTVGAGSSQREDSPAHRLAIRIPCQPRLAPINVRPHGLCSDVARRVAPQTRIAFNNCCVAINTAASRLGHRGGAFVASRPPFEPPPIASCGFLSV